MPYGYAMALLDEASDRHEAAKAAQTSQNTGKRGRDFFEEGPIELDNGDVLPPGFSALTRMMAQVKNE